VVTEIDGGAFVYQVVNGQPKYLLEKSATSDFWGFPKGHVEGQETLVQTAIREIKEETNLDVVIDDNYHVDAEYDMPNGHHKVVTFYTAPVTNPQITLQKEEISAYQWSSYDEARQIVTYDNLKDVLQKANQYLVNKLDRAYGK
jgi:8-oxo-dGTP pyrophosphatase MutT (NUDIX family)